MLRNNVNKHVKNSIRPAWVNENKIWYKTEIDGQSTYQLFDPARGKMISNESKTELFKKGKVTDLKRQNSRISPDGKYEAFIRDWNLWIKEIETDEGNSTHNDGEKDFGYATDNAGWRHSDQSHCQLVSGFQKDCHLSAGSAACQRYVPGENQGWFAPELMAWKYPLPGDEEIIKIHRVIIDISGDDPKMIKVKAGS